MAEIFIDNIPMEVDQVELDRALAQVLHAVPFHTEGQPLINFSVSLQREIRTPFHHVGMTRSGSLTLPNPSIAAEFLRHYGRSSRPRILCDRYVQPDTGRRILFKRSKYTPQADVLAYIQAMPYIDSQVLFDQKERETELKSAVNLVNVQFGWQCRDGMFSIEWDAARDGVLASNPNLKFLPNTSEIRVSLGQLRTPYPVVPDLGRLVHRNPLALLGAIGMISAEASDEDSIVFRFSHIESLGCDKVRSDYPGILFTFIQSPAFERVITKPLNDTQELTTRSRLACLSESHRPVAAFTSLALRVECKSTNELSKFLHHARFAHLPTPIELGNPVERDLFSTDALRRILTWIEELDWVIAFQILKITNDLLVDPQELWNLRPKILAIEGRRRIKQTAEILRLFAARLKTSIPVGEDDLAECLAEAEKDASPLHMAIQNRRKDPGMFSCHHGTVTPTRILLDGPYPDRVRTPPLTSDLAPLTMSSLVESRSSPICRPSRVLPSRSVYRRRHTRVSLGPRCQGNRICPSSSRRSPERGDPARQSQV